MVGGRRADCWSRGRTGTRSEPQEGHAHGQSGTAASLSRQPRASADLDDATFRWNLPSVGRLPLICSPARRRTAASVVRAGRASVRSTMRTVGRPRGAVGPVLAQWPPRAMEPVGPYIVIVREALSATPGREPWCRDAGCACLRAARRLIAAHLRARESSKRRYIAAGRTARTRSPRQRLTVSHPRRHARRWLEGSGWRPGAADSLHAGGQVRGAGSVCGGSSWASDARESTFRCTCC